MSLSTLPPEVLAIIVGKLDQKSVYNLHEADVVCLQGLITECQFSANTLATVESLNTKFFSAVSPYVRVLNLCGVPDLDPPSLIYALSNMENLTDLNVLYTNIRMTDFLQIVKVRPRIKSIAINFTFLDVTISQIDDEILLNYQRAFEGLEHIHFIGPLHKKIHGTLAVRMLERADLRSLKFTSNGIDEAWQSDSDRWTNMKMVKVTQFQVYFLQQFQTYSRYEPPVFDVMDFSKYEILIIKANPDSNPVRRYTVFATPLLKVMISERLTVKVECMSEWPEVSSCQIQNRIGPMNIREVVFMFWDRERSSFDEKIRKKILMMFKKYFVFSLDSDSRPVLAEFEWYSVDPTLPNSSGTCKPRIRSLNPIVELNYGVAFRDKKEVKLDVMFNDQLRCAVPKMINSYNFLGKITHLFFHGRQIRYDLDFFSNLFENCHVLVTLQIVNRSDDCFTSEHVQFISKCKTLRNFLIVSAGLQLTALYEYLSQCRTLENIYLYNSTRLQCVRSLPDPTDLFRNCENLYNFILMSEVYSTSAELKTFYEKVRSDLGKAALKIDIRYFKYGYIHPYVGVFNIYQLKPV